MEGKPVALVTGANKGLGKEVARQLARNGRRVYLASRDAARGERAAAELTAEGLDIRLVQLDVTVDDSVDAVARTLGREAGRLDVLVNNAAILVRRPAFAITAADMRQTYDTNVVGVVRMIHAMLPLLRAAAQPRVVNVASTTASLALTSDAATWYGREDTILAYASSKTALAMLTVQYANAFRRSPDHAHIKINAATPGHIATDLNAFSGSRTAAEGARLIVELAMLADDGPSGGFFNDVGPIPW
jgi:NAD(P)-dependent dehydrogenase (short-subunit alcohol dehydrogenase family)